MYKAQDYDFRYNNAVRALYVIVSILVVCGKH